MKKRNPREKIRYDKYRFSGRERIRYLAVGCSLGGFAVWLCYHTWLAVPAGIPIAWRYMAGKKKQLTEERKKRLNYHFRDVLSSLQTALAAGYSVENGLREAVKDIGKLYGQGDEAVQELERMCVQLRLQIPVEELFEELGQRSGVEDIKNFAEVLAIAKHTGGRLDKIVEDAGRTIRERIETLQEMDAAQASRRYEQQIMSLAPVGIILYLRLSFRGFIEQLYGNILGVVFMSICLGVYLLALWIGKRMVQTGR